MVSILAGYFNRLIRLRNAVPPATLCFSSMNGKTPGAFEPTLTDITLNFLCISKSTKTTIFGSPQVPLSRVTQLGNGSATGQYPLHWGLPNVKRANIDQ